MQLVTSPALAVTHFYFGKAGGVADFLVRDWVSGQCHNAVAVNSSWDSFLLWIWFIGMTPA